MDERAQEEIDWENAYSVHRESLARRQGAMEAHATVAKSNNDAGKIRGSYVLNAFGAFVKEHIALWEQIRALRRRQAASETMNKGFIEEIEGLHENRARTDEQITLVLERLDQFVKEYSPLLEELEAERQERLRRIRPL